MIYTIEEINKNLVEKKNYLEELFEISISEIFVNIITKEEMLKIKKHSWIVGFAIPREKLIMIVAQEESGRPLEDWLKVIIHEMVHIYYLNKFNTDKPQWFFEGLATYIAGQEKKETPISLKDLINLFSVSENNTEIYNKGYTITKRILEHNSTFNK